MKLRRLSKEAETQLHERIAVNQDIADDVCLLTTLRYDPNLKHLTRRVPIAMEDSDEDVYFLSKLHHQKLKYSAHLLGWEARISHTAMLNKMNEAVQSNTEPQRVRVTVNRNGEFTAVAADIRERENLFSGLSISPPKESSDPYYEVIISEERIPENVTTTLKTTNRKMYDQIRLKNLVTHTNWPKEILLVNSKNQVLEGSISSIAVKRNDEWITPKLEDGCMIGVLRSFLLELGYLKEGEISLDDLQDNENILIFNGVQGVCSGFINKFNKQIDVQDKQQPPAKAEN